MIATLDEALFAAPVEPLLLLSILRHGLEGRHIILTDPSHLPQASRWQRRRVAHLSAPGVPRFHRAGAPARACGDTDASPLPQGCQYDGSQEYQRDQSVLADVALDDFLGHDGLTYLLEVLSRGELPQEQVVEMIKRLHTPGYERARFHARAAAAEGVIEPNMAPGFYSQRDIIEVLDWAEAEGRKP